MATTPEHDTNHAVATSADDLVGRLALVTSALATKPGLEETADIVLRQAVAGLRADAGVVGVLSDDGLLTHVASSGFAADLVDRWPLPVTAGWPVTDAVRYGEPVVLVDAADRNERYPDLASVPVRFAGAAFAPLRAGNQAIGVLGVMWTNARALSGTERRFVDALATLLSAAVNPPMASAGGESGVRLGPMSVSAAQRVVDELSTALGDDGCFVACGGPGEPLELLAVSFPDPRAADAVRQGAATGVLLGAHFATQVVKDGTPLFQPELDPATFGPSVPAAFAEFAERWPVRGALAVPIPHPDGAIGLVVTVRLREGDPYRPEDLDTLEAAATRLALDLELAAAREAAGAPRGRPESEALGRWWLRGRAATVLSVLALVGVVGLLAVTDARPIVDAAAAAVAVLAGLGAYASSRQIERAAAERRRAEAAEAAGTERLLRRELDTRRAQSDANVRYRSLVEATTSVVWTSDAQGAFREYQPGWEAFSGQRWSEHAGFGWTSAIHPDDLRDVRDAWRDALSRGGGYEAESRLWHAPSSEYRYTLARAAPIRNVDGSIREWIGTITDIHERRALEAQVAETAGLLRSLLGSAPVGFSFIDADLRVMLLNDHLAQANGLAAEAHVGQRMADVLPWLAPVVEPLCRSVLATGEPVLEVELRAETPASPGVRRDWLTSCYPVRDAGGGVLGVGVAVVELTDRNRALEAAQAARREAEEAAVRAGQLQVISSALAVAATAQEAASAVVRHTIAALGARYGSVSLLAPNGSTLELVGASGFDDATLAQVRSVDATNAPWVSDVLAGRTAYIEDVDEFSLAHPEARLLRLLPDARSWCLVPLVGDGVPFGTLGITFSERHAFAEDERRFIEIVAGLAGEAVRRASALDRESAARRLAEGAADRARAAYLERDRLARSLQESLLPPQLPAPPGMALTARYIPAGEDVIGGDFYDVFETHDGTWHVVLGDVCGKGPDAAALTGLTRYSARAAAIREDDPADILRLVNEAVLRQRTDRFCTAVYVALERGAGGGESGITATVALGGHPQPRLVSAGSGAVSPAGRHGTILGVVAKANFFKTTHILRPGDALVLFTDGLIERTAELDEERLDAVLAECGRASASAEEIADRLVACLEGATGARDDDVAIVVVQARQ